MISDILKRVWYALPFHVCKYYKYYPMTRTKKCIDCGRIIKLK